MSEDSMNNDSRAERNKLLLNEGRSFYDGRIGRTLFLVVVVISLMNLGRTVINLLFGPESELNFVNIFMGLILPALTIFLLAANRRSNRKFYVKHNLHVAEHNSSISNTYLEALREKRLSFSRTPSTAAGISSLDQLEAEIRDAELEVKNYEERVAYHRSRQPLAHEGSLENLEN